VAKLSQTDMTIVMHGDSMSGIARMISGQIGSTVVDKTGLTGKYDYTLSYAPDESMKARIPPLGGPSPGDAEGPGATGPSFLTAVQEQLGLKLEAHKKPVDVVVIDHMEQPTAN
jgi:uncharacterized protein (TIGR03435 family)